MRADIFLVEHGFATTRSQAQRLIASGVRWRVLIDGHSAPVWKRVVKNGDDIPAAAELEVLDSAEVKYISRGGLKLEAALKATEVQVKGLRCLDIGQSTGGFTDCLLQHGAAEVVGVDVGHGQLHATMRENPRVVCIEGVNARALTGEELGEHYRRALHLNNGHEQGHQEGDEGMQARDDQQAGPFPAGFKPQFDFLTGDLSFISLTLVLPAVVRLLKAQGHLLMLVKPQFELQPGQIGKGGIVREPAHFELVEKRLRDACAQVGIDVLGWMASAIEGGDGNREFFIHGKKQHHVVGEDMPLAPAPERQVAKRTPRSELRALHAAHQDSQEAHAGQHGPARSKRRKKYEQDPSGED